MTKISPLFDVSRILHNLGKRFGNNSPISVEAYLADYRERTENRVTRKEFITSLCLYRDSGYCDKDSIKIINKLIGDHKLYKKMVFCTDGSYRNNRVLLLEAKRKRTIALCVEASHGDDNARIPDDPIKRINWMYQHYDKIFIQIPIQRTMRDVDILMGNYFYGKDVVLVSEGRRVIGYIKSGNAPM